MDMDDFGQSAGDEAWQAQAARYDLLSEVVLFVAKTPDLQRMLTGVINKVKWVIDFERCTLALLDDDEQTYQLQTLLETRRDVDQVTKDNIPITVGIPGEVIHTRKMRLFTGLAAARDAISHFADPALEDGSLISILTLPLQAYGKILGAITFSRAVSHSFSRDDLKAVTTFAAHLALAIDRWRQTQQLEQANKELARLASFPQLSPEPVVEVGVDCCIHYLNPVAKELFPNLEIIGPQHPLLANLQTILETITESKRESLTDEIKINDVWYQRVLHPVMGNQRIRIYIVDITERKQAEEAMRQKNEYLAALHEITLNLISRFDLNDLLTALIMRASQLLGTSHGYICLAESFETAQDMFDVASIECKRSYTHIIAIDGHRRHAERIASASSRFVPREFLKALQKQSIVDVELGDGVQSEMTIMFSDVRDFTTLSENMTPKENFDFINSLLNQICSLIREHYGFVDKYMGDGVMALFPRSADDAVQAAITMRQQLAQFNKEREVQGQIPIKIGIGLHSGSLMLETIGEAQRMEGTVISDAVNLASRVEGLTKRYGANLVISEQTLVRLKDRTKYSFRFVDKVQVKGKNTSVSVFEVFDGSSAETMSLKVETKDDFEQGLILYYDKRFPEASVFFNNVLQQNPKDEAARLYLQRAAHYMVQDVPDDWTGTEVMGGK